MTDAVAIAPFQLSETDAWILTIKDDDFIPHSWENMAAIIGQ
jgi:hypothetical protein